jgi:hypothetical protein
MIFLVFYLLALLTASIHLAVDNKPRTRDRVIEIVLLHLLTVAYGLGCMLSFIGHKYRADEIARSIGWPPGNPFQQEVAFANLGCSLVCLLCVRIRGPFWTAAALGTSVFYLGAALIHIQELRKQKNRAVNNAGAILPDLLTPATVLALVYAHQRRTAD